MKVLVIGGTVVISRAIVPQLLAKQHEVTLYNRGSKSLSFAGQVRQEHPVLIEPNAEQPTGEFFNHDSHHFNAIFLAHCPP